MSMTGKAEEQSLENTANSTETASPAQPDLPTAHSAEIATPHQPDLPTADSAEIATPRQPDLPTADSAEIASQEKPDLPKTAVSMAAAQVNDMKKFRNKALMYSGVRLVFVLFPLLVVFFLALAHEEESEVCATNPLPWHTYFLIHSVSSCYAVVMAAMAILSAVMINNKHILRAGALSMQGRDEEAAKEMELGAPSAATGVKIGFIVMCPVCLWSLFSLAWGIVGWVEFANSDGDSEACGVFRTWWIVLFVLGIVSCCIPQPKPKNPTFLLE